MKFGILGCGGIAHRFIAGLQNSDEGELVAVASLNENRLQSFMDQYNVKGYSSYEALLNDPKIDVVYIATYNQNHLELIKLALTHHKHVICEKPMLKNEKEVLEVFALAKQNQLFLMEAHKAPFLPIMPHIKEAITQLGTPIFAYLDYAKYAFYPKDHWVLDKEYGGAMKDIGTYPLSIIYYLWNDSLTTNYSTYVEGDSGCDVLSQVTFKNKDTIVNALGSFALNYKNELFISGPNGFIQAIDFWKSPSVKMMVNNEETILNYPNKSEFTYYINHAIESIKKGDLESSIMSQDASLFIARHAAVLES